LLQIIVLCFVSLFSYSQEFGGGLTAGLTTSHIWGDEMAGFHKAGFTAGGYVNRAITDKLKAQFEMRYVQKGSKNPTDGFKIQLEYIEIPLLLTYDIKKMFCVETGLGYAHLVRAFEGIDDIKFHRVMPRLDIIAYFGASYRFTERLSINGRYAPSIVYVDHFRNIVATFTLCYNLIN
ncbi:MAG: outer membrane beta-barrel protein, partial [Bacteroidales bacterium]|nr:outer membrane beta-barrel protein [Bacteroidales bacterium]